MGLEQIIKERISAGDIKEVSFAEMEAYEPELDRAHKKSFSERIIDKGKSILSFLE